MWCIDVQNGCMHNKSGVQISILWTIQGDLKQELLLCNEHSELRRRQLLQEARQVALKSIA